MSYLHTKSPKAPKRPSHRALLVIAAVSGVMLLVPVRRASAWFGPIIFDPWAMSQHVQQVEQLVQQVQLVAQQIGDQIHELAHLSASVAPNNPVTIAGIQQQLDASLYSTPTPTGQLDSRYPPDMSNATWNQYQTDETTWINNQRQALIENRQLQNQVYQDMQVTQQQVEQIVQASNAAPGETAAAQAHNDLLAVASGELAKLQTLKTARSRLQTENQARQQSELSYAAAERARVRDQWQSPPPPSGTIVNPFAN